MKRSTLLAASLGMAVPFAATARRAFAEAFPIRPVHAIVPWPAGGVVDVVTRALTAKVSQDWNQSFIVEDRPGADGLIGTDFAARAAGDGYTWLIGTLATLTQPFVTEGESESPAEQFSAAAIFAAVSLIAVVPVSLPVNSVTELVALARSQPGKLNYLNPGLGTASSLNTELLKVDQHIDIVSVLYKGQPPGVPDLVSGRLQFALLAPQVAAPLMSAGKVRPLAVAFPRRLSGFPNIPTFAEAGFPHVDVVASYYVLLPKATPRDVIGEISKEINKAVRDGEVRRKMEAAGVLPLPPSTPAQADASLKTESLRWSQFFKQHKIGAKA